MVTGLFCHYLPIYKDVNGVYCSTTLTDSFFQRYFSVVDKLIVADRVYSIDKTYKEAHQEPITIDNVEIEGFPNLSSIRGITVEYSKAKRRIDEFIEVSDLIFVRGGILGILGAESARKHNKPYLIESAGCAWDEYWNYSISGKILAPYMEHMARKTTKNASHVVYVTEKWLQKRYPTNGESTYASNVMLAAIDEEALKERLNRLSDFDGKNLKIGTTGGIGNKAKGQHFVIEAIARLRGKYNITYELVGGGNDTYLKETARKLNVSDNVVFKGQLTHEEVLAWLDSLDLYIQPSMQEGLPRSLIEAMSRACPAVGSTTGGIPELLLDEAVFKRGNVDSLINTLSHIIDCDLVYHAKRNFEKSKEYQIDIINERRSQMYRKYKDFVLKRK